jgi:hypothetical protein
MLWLSEVASMLIFRKRSCRVVGCARVSNKLHQFNSLDCSVPLSACGAATDLLSDLDKSKYLYYTTMTSSPEIISDHHTQALESQVGGHAGVMVTEDGSLLIKPALHHELEFYQAIQQDPKLGLLRDYTPKFIGVLKLEGKLSDLAPGIGGDYFAAGAGSRA